MTSHSSIAKCGKMTSLLLSKSRRNKASISAGDLNVAHKEIDLANRKQIRWTQDLQKKNVQEFDQVVNNDLVKMRSITYIRYARAYSWWSYGEEPVLEISDGVTILWFPQPLTAFSY